MGIGTKATFGEDYERENQGQSASASRGDCASWISRRENSAVCK